MTAHLLLDELRSLGVKFSTDGTTLHIDAPKGVITADHREQIAAQKQDLIALVAHGFPAPGDEDEALYLFALTISLMVDVLGGPDQVRISRVDPNVSFEELTDPSLHVCRAVWPLNEQGQPAKALEKWVGGKECGCTVWLPFEDGYVCAKCYSPRRNEK